MDLTWSNASGNTYNGTILVTAGQLFTTQTLGFQNATLDTTGAASATAFRFSQGNNTIGGLQGSADIQLSRKNSSIEGNDRGGMTLSIGNNNSDTTFSGAITQGAAASSIIKIGTGTQAFSGANTYNGTTAVNAGTLLIDGTHIASTGNASYSVNGANSTLGGNGRIAVSGAITANSSTFIAPGANGSIGALTVDGVNKSGTVLSMATGSRFAFQLAGNGGTPDQLNFWNYLGGDLTLNSNGINLTLSGAQTNGTYTVDIFRFFSDSGTAATTHDFASGLTIGTLGSGIQSASIDWNGSLDNNQTIALTYTVVPEPSSTVVFVLAALGMLVLLKRRRRA